MEKSKVQHRKKYDKNIDLEKIMSEKKAEDSKGTLQNPSRKHSCIRTPKNAKPVFTSYYFKGYIRIIAERSGDIEILISGK